MRGRGGVERHRPGCRDADEIPAGGGAAGVLATAATGGCRSAFAAILVVLYLPYVAVGWHVLGFLPGYASEEGFDSGHGIFLLQLLSSVVTLPGWASTAYICAALGVLGLLGARFALGGNLPARRMPV